VVCVAFVKSVSLYIDDGGVCSICKEWNT